jgi:geranylgeranyl diphosphate synthase, type II
VSRPATLALPPNGSRPASADFLGHLAEYREVIVDRMNAIITEQRLAPPLDELMLEYPLRGGKAFRGALCLAVCQACSGTLDDAIDSAAAIELLHNAFLIHDDIEDGSLLRRGRDTFHRKYGIAVATNVGDAMQVLSLRTLLDNASRIGLDRAFQVANEVERMACMAAEGQAIELDWIRSNRVDITVGQYLDMVRRKTCGYTTIGPMRIGAILAERNARERASMTLFALRIGWVFQIQDDLLNLRVEDGYGKEQAGDLWEGKRTLMLIHTLGSADATERKAIARILRKTRARKTESDVALLAELVQKHGGKEFASAIARRISLRARQAFERELEWLPDGENRRFLRGMVEFMSARTS